MTGRPSVLLAAGCGCLAAAAVATATSPGGLRAASEGLRRRRRATASSTSTSAAAAGPPPLEMEMDEDAFAAFLETESFFDLGRHLQASGGGPGRGCNGDADARAEAIADLVASIDGLSPEAADWVQTLDVPQPIAARGGRTARAAAVCGGEVVGGELGPLTPCTSCALAGVCSNARMCSTPGKPPLRRGGRTHRFLYSRAPIPAVLGSLPTP